MNLTFLMFFVDMVELKYQNKTLYNISVLQTKDKQTVLTYLRCEDMLMISGGLTSAVY